MLLIYNLLYSEIFHISIGLTCTGLVFLYSGQGFFGVIYIILTMLCQISKNHD